jgi:hypothetical protein
MRTLINVARLHVVAPLTSVVLAWGILALSWAINLVLFSTIPTPKSGGYSGGLASIYIFMIVLGSFSTARYMPLGFTLGLSRRTYYLGLITLIGGLGVLYAAVLTGLRQLEGITDGWGVRLHFFRVAWILDGPWYEVLLTTFVLMVLTFLGGAWLALVNRRFGLLGLVGLFAAAALALLVVALLITWQSEWTSLGHYLRGMSEQTATGFLALAAAIVGLGGYATIRGVTV